MSSSLKGDKVPCARLCHIVKWEDFEGYGFNLHAQKGKNGQYIGKVDDGSPSQAAGLRQGDRIIEVNEINIANETHKQVVERIKAFPNETKLLVVDQEADDYFKANNIIVKGTMTSGIKVIKTPERNPNTVENEDRRSVDSNDASVDENTRKSTGSNDTSHSGSTAPAPTPTTSMTPPTMTITTNENTTEDLEPRENGNDSAVHAHGTGNGSIGSASSEQQPQQQAPRQGLNLKMSAKELRAQLAARKKYDPKKESIGFKDKFDIVQKL